MHAREEMVYTNNSPDTLKSIYLHLWPNAYKNDHTPFAQQQDEHGSKSFYYSKPADKGYIDSLDFYVDGQSVEHFIAENTPDIARIDLATPLLPGHKINISTPFRVKIPIIFSRLGHTGQAYCISQWFPKPAVYDKTGWHPISFLEQGEFYSEYGSYDVNITLPVNYVVMATGNCMDEAENTWLDSLSRLPQPQHFTRVDTAVESAKALKTIHFHEDNIHDFAWFADKRWIVRKDSVVSPGSGEKVYTWAAYLPSDAKAWAKTNQYLAATVKHYGKWVGPYPYKTIKAVLGDMKAGGGMEYPTVTVINKASSPNLQATVVHEAGHNWFYGILGSNERDHAWMDEGINTYYEKRTVQAMEADSAKHKRTKSLFARFNEELFYFEHVATNIDQPIEQTSDAFTKINYGVDVYHKTALMLQLLEHYMGEDSFSRGMQYYYQSWRFKHPYPEDFRACMQKNCSRPLDWFFDGMLHTTQKIDFTITDASVSDGVTELTVRNNSGLLCPVLVDACLDGAVVAQAWAEPFAGTTKVRLPSAVWNELKIDSLVPDAKTANNVYRRHGISHRFGLELKAFSRLNRDEKYPILLLPTTRYDQYDGIMLGLTVHNLTVPENRFRFLFSPLYSFATGGIAGTGSVGYMWYPRHTFQDILAQVDGKTFHDNETLINRSSPLYARYSKIAPSITFRLKEPSLLSTVTRSVQFKGYRITEDGFTFAPDTRIIRETKNYGLAAYSHRNGRPYNPFCYSFEGQIGADFAKISAEGCARVDYNVKNKALYLRAYFGKFFAINNDPAIYGRYELNSSYSGVNDYLYDGSYIARNAPAKAGQQVSYQEGGFKVPVFNNVDRSDNWLGSINLETDLPLRNWPVRLFLDAGLIPNTAPTISNNRSTTMLYDAGFSVVIVRDIVNVFVPVVMSNDFQNYLRNSYGNKNYFVRGISFTIQLQHANPLTLPKKFLDLTTY